MDVKYFDVIFSSYEYIIYSIKYIYIYIYYMILIYCQWKIMLCDFFTKKYSITTNFTIFLLQSWCDRVWAVEKKMVSLYVSDR